MNDIDKGYCHHDWVDRTEILRQYFWGGKRYLVCLKCCRIKVEDIFWE